MLGTCSIKGGASQASTTPAVHVQITPLTPIVMIIIEMINLIVRVIFVVCIYFEIIHFICNILLV